MAEKRIISKSIYTRKTFLQLSPTARDLYTYLELFSDNDGVTEAYHVMRLINGNESDLFLLEQTGYVKILDSDLRVYLTEWQQVNCSLKDKRGTKSIYRPLLIKVLPQIEEQLFEYKNSKNSKKNNNQEVPPELPGNSPGSPQEFPRNSPGIPELTENNTTQQNRTEQNIT